MIEKENPTEVISDRGSFYLGFYYAHNIYIYMYACDMMVCVIYKIDRDIYIYVRACVLYSDLQYYTMLYCRRCYICYMLYCLCVYISRHIISML